MADSGVVGTPEGVRELAIKLVNDLRNIKDTNNTVGKNLLNTLGQSSKDKTYDYAEELVNQITRLITSSLEPAKETYDVLQEYANFLEHTQNIWNTGGN